MKLLWIGEYTNSDLMKKLLEYGYSPMSNSIAQKNLILGIKEYYPVDTISGCRLPYSLKRGRMIFHGYSWEDPDLSQHTFVDLMNIKYIELLFKGRMLKKAASKWAKENKSEECYIIVYSLHSPNLACIPAILKIIPKAKIICIVPDLPEYFDFNMSILKTFLKKIDLIIMSRYKKFISKYIFFTENMAQYLHIPTGKYIVMEGSVRINDENEFIDLLQAGNGKKKIVLYTGSVSHGYGINKLLDAFAHLNDESYELWIAGNGNAVELVTEAAMKNSRIKYLGYIHEREKILILQKKATMLMCMIPPENRATHYCFPSKILEYMLSGTPTLAFRLKGIPEIYYNYLVEIDGTMSEDIAKKILQIGSMTDSERCEMGKKSRDYIICEKNNIIQAKRVLDFILL